VTLWTPVTRAGTCGQRTGFSFLFLNSIQYFKQEEYVKFYDLHLAPYLSVTGNLCSRRKWQSELSWAELNVLHLLTFLSPRKGPSLCLQTWRIPTPIPMLKAANRIAQGVRCDLSNCFLIIKLLVRANYFSKGGFFFRAGDWIQDLVHTRQVLYHLSFTSSPFKKI
jgi:hypothetical protein